MNEFGEKVFLKEMIRDQVGDTLAGIRAIRRGLLTGWNIRQESIQAEKIQ
jgi:hypothetical protein